MTLSIPNPELAHRPFLRHGTGRGAVLLVHGFPGSPAELRPLARGLHQAGWTVAGPELTASSPGESAVSAGETWLGQVAGLHDQLAADHARTVLLGYSMGAALALIEAVRRPPARLVLIAPFHEAGSSVGDLLRPALRWIPRRFRPSEAALAAGAGAQPSPPSRGTANEGLPAELRRIGRRAYTLAPRVAVPSLVVHGERDEVAPSGHVRRLLGRLGGPKQLITLPGDHALLEPDGPAWGALESTILAALAREGP